MLATFLCSSVIACKDQSSERLAQIESRLSALEAKLSDPVPKTTPEPTPTPLVSEAIADASYSLSGNEKDDPFLGSSSAPILLIAFFDYGSASSRKFVETTLPALKETELKNGQVKFLLRDFPLSTTEEALLPAITAHCLGEQGKYWKFFDAFLASDLEQALKILPEIDREKLSKCQNSNRYYLEIERDIADARALGARGAPSFFLGKCQESSCNGKFIRGAQPIGVFRRLIHEISASDNNQGSADRG